MKIGQNLLYNGEKVSEEYIDIIDDHKYYSKGFYPFVCEHYAFFLYEGNVTPVNKSKAATYFKIEADKGLVKSMNKYAYMLKNGIIIEKNLQEAARYYKMAADEDDEEGNANYGDMLFNGIGIPVNYNEAFKCFKKAFS